MTDIKALKALAEAAKPNFEDSGLNYYPEVESFISAANPAAVLEMIAEIERLHLENGSLRGSCKTTGKDLTTAVRACNKATKERDQLKAENFDLGAGRQAAEDEIARIKAENEALRKDAVRYRAIRDDIPHIDLGRAILEVQTSAEYDAAVDAMSKEASHE